MVLLLNTGKFNTEKMNKITSFWSLNKIKEVIFPKRVRLQREFIFKITFFNYFFYLFLRWVRQIKRYFFSKERKLEMILFKERIAAYKNLKNYFKK